MGIFKTNRVFLRFTKVNIYFQHLPKQAKLKYPHRFKIDMCGYDFKWQELILITEEPI